MPAGYTADTDVMRNAASILNSAHQFFNDRLVTLQRVAGESADEPFVGGHGETGGFQRGLRGFDKRFQEVLEQYVEDERNFVLFLQQAHARLTGNAALYDSTERDNTLRMTAISRELDGDQA
jgi:hypothetical protein